MFTYVKVENFRGIERLEVEGMSRVNLIIGRNNSGKTALMEALSVAVAGADAGAVLWGLQALRMSNAKPEDFEEFWRPLFREGDVGRGFLVAARGKGPVAALNGDTRVFVRRARRNPPATATDQAGPSPRTRAWALDIEFESNRGLVKQEIIGTRQGVEFTPDNPGSTRVQWISSGIFNWADVIRMLSLLKQDGREGLVRELLVQLDDRIEGFEILSPTGTKAAIFIRIRGAKMLLPLQVMGEGLQRCFDIAVSLAASDTPLLCIDEIENGLHHTTLEPVWRWLAETSRERGIQVFATTHSEECVQAACRAFSALNDDSLRVIRLDRREHEIEAAVYDRELVSAAGQMGVEIRG